MSGSDKEEKIESFQIIQHIKSKLHLFSRGVLDGTDLPIDGRKNIFANFDDLELKEILESWAKEHDFTMTFGDGPAIIGDLFFIGIVDRFCFSGDYWKNYSEYVDFVINGPSEEDIIECGLDGEEFTSGTTEPIIIIDRMGCQNDPPNAPFFHVDKNDVEIIKKIILHHYKPDEIV